MTATAQTAPRSDDRIGRIETEVALLLRLSDRNRRRSRLMDGALERSAYLALRLPAQVAWSVVKRLLESLRAT